jgi:type IV secretion system protein VirB10
MSDTDLPRDTGRSTQRSAPIIDRTISPVAGRFGAGRAGKIVTVAALAAGCGIFMYASWKHGPTKPQTPLEPASQVVAFEPAKTDAVHGASAAPTLANPGAGAPVLGPAPAAGVNGPVPALQPGGVTAAASAASAAQAAAQARAAKLQAIRGAPILAFSQGGGGLGAVSAAIQPLDHVADGAAHTPTELEKLRQGSVIGMAQASRLPDRNFLITAGTAIPCILQTAMDTSTLGYVSCVIPTDVYSDNGAVVLMEKGTKVLGEYGSGMHQGQNRLFVLWTRAVTPAGVAIGLTSPASDALGRAGFDVGRGARRSLHARALPRPLAGIPGRHLRAARGEPADLPLHLLAHAQRPRGADECRRRRADARARPGGGRGRGRVLGLVTSGARSGAVGDHGVGLAASAVDVAPMPVSCLYSLQVRSSSTRRLA